MPWSFWHKEETAQHLVLDSQFASAPRYVIHGSAVSINTVHYSCQKYLGLYCSQTYNVYNNTLSYIVKIWLLHTNAKRFLKRLEKKRKKYSMVFAECKSLLQHVCHCLPSKTGVKRWLCYPSTKNLTPLHYLHPIIPFSWESNHGEVFWFWFFRILLLFFTYCFSLKLNIF